MSRGFPVRDAVSAGGVVFRIAASGPEVVICRVAGRDVWALPKGTPDLNEQHLDTALREVREETGLEVEAQDKLGEIDYWFVQQRQRVHKVVHFWLMSATGGSIEAHDAEFDAIEWVAIDEAIERLTYRGEKDIVMTARERLAAGV